MAKLTRTLTITMEATVENHKRVFDFIDSFGKPFDSVEYRLSENPKPGEAWKNGWGETIFLVDSKDKNFPLADIDKAYNTWTKEGLLFSYVFNRSNLVERVSEEKS